jgi:hypothetical protein
MKTINKPSDNLGGVLKLYAIPPSLVSSLVAGILTLSGTSSIVEIYFTTGTLDVETEHVPSREDRAGGYHSHKISAFVPKLRQMVENELEDMRNHSFVVVVLDGNEQYWAHGTAGNTLKFGYKAKTGGDTQEINGYSIYFEGKTITPPMIISDPF